MDGYEKSTELFEEIKKDYERVLRQGREESQDNLKQLAEKISKNFPLILIVEHRTAVRNIASSLRDISLKSFGRLLPVNLPMEYQGDLISLRYL